MDHRIGHLPPAAWRIVRRKAGMRLDEGLRVLIEMWARGQVDPLNGQTPGQVLAASGGKARAAALDDEERSKSGRHAARARWTNRPKE